MEYLINFEFFITIVINVLNSNWNIIINSFNLSAEFAKKEFTKLVFGEFWN